MERIQMELAPSADLAAAQLKWADLAYSGDIEAYFTEVRELS